MKNEIPIEKFHIYICVKIYIICIYYMYTYICVFLKKYYFQRDQFIKNRKKIQFIFKVFCRFFKLRTASFSHTDNRASSEHYIKSSITIYQKLWQLLQICKIVSSKKMAYCCQAGVFQ